MKLGLIFYVLMLLHFTTFAQKPANSDKYKLVVINGGEAGNMEKSFVRLEVYIVNNSDDTLSYCGTECLYTKLFSISPNKYLYLEEEDCKNQSFTEYIIPPHRSQKMTLLLSEYKQPDTIINLKVNMKVFKWVSGKFDNLNSKYLIGTLTDKVTVKFDKAHNQISDKQDFDINNQKGNNIPPDINLHLLTRYERSIYTLTIDQKKIIRDTSVSTKTKEIFVHITVPVMLNNNSNDTLKFLTMVCSWYDDFKFNNHNMGVFWPCTRNFPEPIILPPHGNFVRELPLSYNASVKKGTKFKVAMSLTIKDNSHVFFDLYPHETNNFNLIWSNEVEIP